MESRDVAVSDSFCVSEWDHMDTNSVLPGLC